MKYECTQSIWGLCKSLIRGKLNVPFGGSVKIYAYSIFWSQTTKMQKVWHPTYCSKHMYIKAWKFAKGIHYISCGIYCLLMFKKRNVDYVCFDIRCRKTYILSLSFSQLLKKKVDYLLWSLSTRHKRPIVIIVEVQYELGNGKLTHMIINRCWMIPYLISAKNIHIFKRRNIHVLYPCHYKC